jgi:2-keto-3-deoxy-L-rhamnonate aldolase RhmA
MTFRPKPNRILEALKKGDIPLGMEINTGDTSLIEILAYTGFDFLMLDMEHSRLNIETMDHCIRAADAAGITTIVRIIENSASLIRQAQEAGAQGIMIPHIENAQEARKAVESLRYPPEGKCGVCPSIRAANYSHTGWQEYMEYSNKNTMLILLLEDKNGIANAEEIFAQLKPGVDAVGIGMADIANSLLTQPGQKINWQHPYLAEAFEKVMAISKKTGIPIISMLTPPSPEGYKAALAKGIKIILYFIDQQIFYNFCLNAIREVRRK